MNKNKGAINIILIIFVVVVALAVGYFAFQKSDTSPTEQPQGQSTSWKNSDGSCVKTPQFSNFNVEVFKGQPKFIPTWPGMQENVGLTTLGPLNQSFSPAWSSPFKIKALRKSPPSAAIF